MAGPPQGGPLLVGADRQNLVAVAFELGGADTRDRDQLPLVARPGGSNGHQGLVVHDHICGHRVGDGNFETPKILEA